MTGTNYEGHDAFWATFLGAEPDVWQRSGLVVHAHAGLAGYSGVWFFSRGTTIIVSAPPDWVATLNLRIDPRLSFDALTSEENVRTVFGNCYERQIGPAFHGALAPPRFAPVESSHVRPIELDAPLADLERACSDDDVAASGLPEAAQHRFGYWQANRLTAACGYRAWSDTTGDPCVLTRPDERGRGHAAAVVSATVARALEAGKLLLFQTLEANFASMRLAQRLGYEPYARHVAVRLTSAQPP